MSAYVKRRLRRLRAQRPAPDPATQARHASLTPLLQICASCGARSPARPSVIGEPGGRFARRAPVVESIRHDVVVSLGRIAWITTVAVFVIAAICLFFSDYTGYAVLSLAVAASAAINLR